MLKNAFYIALFAIISWGSYQISYPSNTTEDLFYDGIIFENVIKHIDKITQGPRAVGDYYHEDVKRYLTKQLQNMGFEVSIQKSTNYNPKNKTAAPIRNVIATYSGTAKDHNSALLIMAHYDAAKFSGTGAGDDASGVAVILETVNALLKSKQNISNDLIVLFTDAEEIGLLGARAFINEQLNNHDIKLILNLEARGTSGPSMMWPETDGGNRAMIEGFAAADVPLPVTTSLHYEIYKMLPNDTDLSPFNQLAKINGFNFAFIDDHFNYHTRRDNPEHLSLNTLAHQTFQIHNMLKYFSNADLNQVKSSESMVYFTLPMIGLIYYPGWVTWLLLGLFGAAFVYLLATAIKRQQISVGSISKGMLRLSLAIALSFGWCWVLVKALYGLHPEFNDILQGFPYSGHHIMAAFLISSAFMSVAVLTTFRQPKSTPNLAVSCLLWLILITVMVSYLPGSGMLVWPLLLSIVLFAVQILQPKFADDIASVFAVLAFILLGTLVINLPIALGVKSLPITVIFVSLLLALFTPMLNQQKHLTTSALFIVMPLIYLVWHLYQQPTISAQHPHPTSLSYLYDLDTKQGHYFNYDVVNSGWNEGIFNKLSTKKITTEFSRKYKKPVKNHSVVDQPIVIDPIQIKAQKQLNVGETQKIDLTIKAHSNTEIIEIFSQQAMTLSYLSIEGRYAVMKQPMTVKPGEKILQYYFNGKKEISLQIEINAKDVIDWQLQTHSLDLLTDESFAIKPRPVHQIAKPFIKSDNTIAVQSFSFGNDQ